MKNINEFLNAKLNSYITESISDNDFDDIEAKVNNALCDLYDAEHGSAAKKEFIDDIKDLINDNNSYLLDQMLDVLEDWGYDIDKLENDRKFYDAIFSGAKCALRHLE